MIDVHSDTMAAELAATAASPGEVTLASAWVPGELSRGTLVGRYVVLSKLGAGGMGVVYVVHDPELDRRVALKLLNPQLDASVDAGTLNEARTRLVREAQALAKLNHPHIVAVHDAGEHDGAVWLAMEYVDGETLGVWMKGRRHTWREVLDMLTPAARGLAAAHRSGLVHRDIKPDNIMVGNDGRVRVMDLGLARAVGGEGIEGVDIAEAKTATAGELDRLSEQVTRVGAVLGTPAYMSPEQFRGSPADARADVFSLCVTMWEALYAERPFAGSTLVELAANVLSGTVRPTPRDPMSRRVPAWLRRACLRGLAAEPEKRYASMDDLLAALSRGRQRARVRKWIAAAVAVAAIAALGVAAWQFDVAQRTGACEEVGASIAEVWNETVRGEVREGLIATGLSYAPVTADKLMPFLDAHAESWNEHRSEVCLAADVEQTLDPVLFDRAVWCLDERRMAFAALVDELKIADTSVVNKAVTAAAGLEPVLSCTEPMVLTALPDPPPVDARDRADALRRKLARGRSMERAGKYKEGLELARAVLADAEDLDLPSITAAARLLEGNLLAGTGAYAESETATVTAFMDASRIRAWNVAADAATLLAYTVGNKQARFGEGEVWARHAEVAISFAGDPLGLREAGRLNSFALVHSAAGHYDQQRALLEQALKIRRATTGDDHPNTARILNNLGAAHRTIGNYEEAKQLFEQALAIQQQALGDEHPIVVVLTANLGALHWSLREYAVAKPLFERALAIRERMHGGDSPQVAESLNHVAFALHGLGKHTEAREYNERALKIWEDSLGREHPLTALCLWLHGDIALALDATDEALALLERAISIYDKHEGVQEFEHDARFSLARALVRSGAKDRALAEARRSADGFRAIGKGKARELSEVEAFIAEQQRDEPPG